MPSTSYLKKISDNFGLWQHVIDGEISLKDGYSLDDNLRGLLVAHKLGDLDLVKVYFDYLERSFNPKTKMFIEFFDADRQPINEEHINPSYDTQSMARFILTYCIKNSIEVMRAQDILKETKPFDYKRLPHLRPLAYELLMCCEDKSQRDYGNELVHVFMERFNSETKWFEPKLTYANALLLYAITRFHNEFELNLPELRNLIEDSMEMLDTESRVGIIPAPPGNREWFIFGENRKDVYGQQPIDAGFMVMANLQLDKMTNDPKYKQSADDWYQWFTGNNIYKQTLIKDNGCADGIDQNGISRNFGAESTIIYLWASIEFKNINN